MTHTTKTQFGFASRPALVKGAEQTVKLVAGYRLGFTKCFGCNSMCALRYRVDEKTGEITRVAGNPYSDVLTAGKPLPLETHLDEAYWRLADTSRGTFRASICGRGASTVGVVTSPQRITKVLKRAGKRGENRWKSIPYEQAIKEIVNGGNLFGEGRVEGLRQIYDPKTLLDPAQPEFGSKSNQLLVAFNEEDTMRGAFLTRFSKLAFGSVNALSKHAYCGNGPAIGYSVGLGPTIAAGLCEPDWDHFEYAVFIGTSPSNSGFSLNRRGSGVAQARVERKAEYVVVDPLLRSSAVQATGARWCPILPGTDDYFLYGLVRVILENGWENKHFLTLPNLKAAQKAGEVNYSNATHLVVVTPDRPDTLTMADAQTFGVGKKGVNVVCSNGKLVAADAVESADLYADLKVKLTDGKTVHLMSSAQMLRHQANKLTLTQYSEQCGVPEKEIRAIARKLTEHGRKAAVVFFGGLFGCNAAMAGWLCCILNTLIGCHDARGGAMYSGGTYMGFAGNYDLASFAGKVDLKGQITITRSGPYEASSEYKQHLMKSEKPYPAAHVFHPMNPGYASHNAAAMITAAVNGDPYKAKALITWRSNPVYSTSSFDSRTVKGLADPKVIPLVIGIDAFINETNQYADYIIPDTVQFEDYACDRTWGSFYPWVSAGVPAVESHTVKNAAGMHVCMEQFCIDCAVAMKLPGFGKGAISCKDGRKLDLLTPEDWYPRYLANIAVQLKHLPEVSAADRELAGLGRAMKFIETKVTSGEAVKIEALLSRGGYYEAREHYKGDFFAGAGGKFLQLFSPAMTAIRHAYSGERYPGVPVAMKPRFFNGKLWETEWPADKFPLRLSTFKSSLRSPYSVVYPRNLENSPQNFVQMHEETAAKYGLKTGDRVRIISGNGVPTEGILQADKSVAKGAVCVAHGYGHSAYGAKKIEVDGQVIGAVKGASGGIAINGVIPHDPTFKDQAALLNDYWVGATCRSGIPVRVEKVA